MLSTVFYGQTIEKLDERGGFRDFKIGDSFQKWSSQLEYRSDLNKVKTYTYKGECCRTLYGSELESIVLGFIDNKLAMITLLSRNVPVNGEPIVTNPGRFSYKFIEDFGKDFTFSQNESEGKMQLVWKGKKITLTSMFKFLGTYKGELFMIVITDAKTDNHDGL